MKVKKDIRQLKMINGDEVICEVVEEHKSHFIVRNALKLKEKLTEENHKYFTFSSYMTYQDGLIQVIMLMTRHIMAFAIPTKEMIFQYDIALEQIDNLKNSVEEEPILDEAVEDWLENIVEDMNKKRIIH
jgi:hypothetical protein|tara:strand:- start:4589 stop:4978 length:390 start_codon:yes stop_codon:yes gene_type:complete